MPTDMKAHFRRLCQARPGRIGFPEARDARMLEVASKLLDEGSVERVSLFGDENELLTLAAKQAIDLAAHHARIDWIAKPADGESPLMQAAHMLAGGQLDAVLGGNLASTAEVIRAGIKGVGLAAGVKTVSGGFIMSRPPQGSTPGANYLYADAAVVIAPTVAQLVDIASESVKTWRQIFPDVPPVVAFLSFSTKGSAVHEAAMKMSEAATLFKARHPDVDSDGELQFDAAFDAAIGQRKAPGSPAAGRANVFIFPDLGAGNIAYKITQRLGGFEAYGPFLQGLRKPYSDLSRGSTVNDILASAYLTLLRRQ